MLLRSGMLKFALGLVLCAGASPILADGKHDHAAPQPHATASGVRYGAEMPAQPAALALAEVLSAPDAHLKQPGKYSGRIGKVCQKAGCWMSLTAGDQAVRVVFGDHAFSIPLDSQGEATVFGQLEKQMLSEDMAKHLAEDAGADPAKVQGEQQEYRLVATSVEIVAAQ